MFSGFLNKMNMTLPKQFLGQFKTRVLFDIAFKKTKIKFY